MPVPRHLPQVTIRGLLVLVAEAALVCAALAALPEAELRGAAAVAVIPLVGALWGGLRGRRRVVSAFRGGVFAGALQSAFFALWDLLRLVLGQVHHADLNAAAVAAFEIAVVLVTSLLLGAILGLMVGAGVRLGSRPPRHEP